MAKPMKTLQLHYPMIQVLINVFIIWRRVFYWELNHSKIPYATTSGTRVAYFPYVTFVSVVSFNDVTPFAFVELVSPYNKKNITRWLEDMNFTFSWQEQNLTRSLRSLVRYCSCHSNIKFISSHHRVISSLYSTNQFAGSVRTQSNKQ